MFFSVLGPASLRCGLALSAIWPMWAAGGGKVHSPSGLVPGTRGGSWAVGCPADGLGSLPGKATHGRWYSSG